MLLIENLSEKQLQDVSIACSYLFSPELARDDEFVINLELASIKKALEEKEKRYDPALHPDESEEMILKRKERFIKIKQSYETLIPYIFEEKKIITEQDSRESRIIAVGGAKGGIGKSTFATNLGIYLSSLGKRTVLVDLDLGGANLHLYLGERFLKYNINDYLNKNVPSISDIMVSTKYGPDLVGGGSSQLGSANIHFSRKLKLLRAIKQIDADYIIIDLGADTSYNIIDFFLAADHGIVLTTCDPAYYLDAYNLIKVSLFRKLNRIFGPESELRQYKDPDLLWLIKDATMSGNGNKGKVVGDLIERVKKELPEGMPLIEHVLETFRPGLVVNMISENDNVSEVVNRVKDIFEREIKWLERLQDFDRTPDIIKIDYTYKILLTSYCGEPLKKENMPYDWDIQVKYIYSKLQEYGCCYNDIKPGDLLINNGEIMICDFGWATEVGEPIPTDWPKTLGLDYAFGRHDFNDLYSMMKSIFDICNATNQPNYCRTPNMHTNAPGIEYREDGCVVTGYQKYFINEKYNYSAGWEFDQPENQRIIQVFPG